MYKKFIYGLIAGIIFFLGWWLVIKPQPATVIPQPTTTADETDQSNIVTVVIGFGDGQEITSDVAATTAFSALEAAASANNLELKTKVYDFGTLVEKVGEFENSAEKAWIYYVNGESGQVAADQMELKAGDMVEWKYVKPI